MRYVVDMYIWYRHSGQPEVDEDEWSCSECVSKELREVIDDVGNYRITHATISAEHLQSLRVIANDLTHLKLNSIKETTDLQRCLSSCKCVHPVLYRTYQFKLRISYMYTHATLALH